jgi:hypothetical protein
MSRFERIYRMSVVRHLRLDRHRRHRDHDREALMAAPSRCRVLVAGGIQCHRQAVEEDGELLICIVHLMKAEELLKANGAVIKFDSATVLAETTEGEPCLT